MQRTVTIQIGVCIQYDKQAYPDEYPLWNRPIAEPHQKANSRFKTSQSVSPDLKVYVIVIQCLSIRTASPNNSSAYSQKILVGHCSVMHVRKLTRLYCQYRDFPYDRIRYSCLANTMKGFLHIRPFHRRIILCQISHLEHGIYFLTIGNQPVHLRIKDLRTLFQISLRIRQYHKKVLTRPEVMQEVKKSAPKKRIPITDNTLIIFFF